MALQISKIETRPDNENLPGAVRKSSDDWKQFVDAVKSRRVFRFQVAKADEAAAKSAVRRAAAELNMGVRIISGVRGDVAGIQAQGKDRRNYKPRAPLTDAQKAERKARREAKAKAAAK